jgi:hypothetical protein
MSSVFNPGPHFLFPEMVHPSSHEQSKLMSDKCGHFEHSAQEDGNESLCSNLQSSPGGAVTTARSVPKKR